MRRHLLFPVLLGAGIACHPPVDPAPDVLPGISHELARHRARTLSDVRYEIALTIPADPSESIQGRETVRFRLSREAGPLVLDFAGPAASVLAVRTADGEAAYRVEPSHVVVPGESLTEGENAVEIEFVAGDSSLNRRDGYLYTLFVPDRAHHAFPCFDQPDMKARFRLTLELPASWQAVAGGALLEKTAKDATTTWSFAETEPIPTYLFAFAAGELQVETAERDGRTMSFYHRETDAEKVERNREAIFDLHQTALAWLEEYTGIAYPFGKFDFVLVPAFQYGGMEHPGSIFYRDSALFLDESATQDDYLRRASLIAHETAHMWFGDLVTMRWFDDVWMKEVFANFMAAKIVHPSFPEVDHDLRFLLAHFPGAYGVDRSAGTHPIRQELANLQEAGSLYGAIIYQKAPIVMRHLEVSLGEETLREGLREYLSQHRFGNASWDDLISILDRKSEVDLASWSRVWVSESGRPAVKTEVQTVEGKVTSLLLTQTDPSGGGRLWPQHLQVTLGRAEDAESFAANLDGGSAEVDAARERGAPDWVLPGSGGLGYARFELDGVSRADLLVHLAELEKPLWRGVGWLTLWDEMLEGRIAPPELFETALALAEAEPEAQLAERVLRDLRAIFWRYLTAEERAARAGRLEELLWGRLLAVEETSLKASFYRAYEATASSAGAVDRLLEVWRRGKDAVPGLPLSEDDLSRLALELAVREAPGTEEILARQLERIENPDRRARFEFVVPAVSAAAPVRDAFFASLADPARREQEPWVIEALTYLHHPLRASASEKYVLPSLEMLEEIWRTGDIFFPRRWLDATLGGHSSPAVASTVREFLARRPDYPPRLRGKILQAADELFRAAARRL